MNIDNISNTISTGGINGSGLDKYGRIPLEATSDKFALSSKDFTGFSQAAKWIVELKNLKPPELIVNLCDGMGYDSLAMLDLFPNATIHSVDLNNYSRISPMSDIENDKLKVHWNTNALNFLSKAEDGSIDILTLIGSDFLYEPYNAITEEVRQKNIKILLELLPLKLKNNGLLVIAPLGQNSTFRIELIKAGFKDEGFGMLILQK
jgi:hypothetical protein